MGISPGFAKRCLRRGERSLFVDPLPQTVENGPRVGLAASAAFLRGVARSRDWRSMAKILAIFSRPTSATWSPARAASTSRLRPWLQHPAHGCVGMTPTSISS